MIRQLHITGNKLQPMYITVSLTSFIIFQENLHQKPIIPTTHLHERITGGLGGLTPIESL
jgi:hypothetical protein